MNEKIEAYKEILDVLNKHAKILKKDRNDLIDRFSSRLEQLEVIDLFKIDPDFVTNGYDDWVNINPDISFGKYGPSANRSIAWEDNGKQPENEWLLNIRFSSGAFIFGRDYPTDLFEQFFEEFKNFNPKYIDSNNHALYYDHTNAKSVYDEYPNILKKYKDQYMILNSEKMKRIKELEQELYKLKNS